MNNDIYVKIITFFILVSSLISNGMIFGYWLDKKYSKNMPLHIFVFSIIGILEIIFSAVSYFSYIVTEPLKRISEISPNVSLFFLLIGLYTLIIIFIFTKNRKE